MSQVSLNEGVPQSAAFSGRQGGGCDFEGLQGAHHCKIGGARDGKEKEGFKGGGGWSAHKNGGPA